MFAYFSLWGSVCLQPFTLLITALESSGNESYPMARKSSNFFWMSLVLCFVCGCRNKLPSDSSLLNPPSRQPIGTIKARESLLKALMASHSADWSDSELHFQEAHKSDPHPTIVELHAQVQQASKSLEETTRDQ